MEIKFTNFKTDAKQVNTKSEVVSRNGHRPANKSSQKQKKEKQDSEDESFIEEELIDEDLQFSETVEELKKELKKL